MADNRHTSMAFVAPHVASKYDLLPHAPAFQPHFHSCQTAPLYHNTPQHTLLLSTWPELVLLISACLPTFAFVHSLVVICWRAWVK